MLWRRVTLLTIVALVGCEGSDDQAPTVSEITPGSGLSAAPTAVTILGSEFRLGLAFQVDDTSPAEPDARFSASLSNEASSDAALEDVVWVDTETLNAVVPSGLNPGVYDLVVTGPGGTSQPLLGAFTVCGGGVCACTDGDGDGWGRAGTEQSECTNAGDDCDDASEAIFPGAPEIPDDSVDQNCDGVDSVTCVRDDDMDGLGTDAGTTVVAADGSCDTADGEADSASDCDDANPACGTDCSDTDGDGVALCAGDCDDSALTGAACAMGCTSFYADGDGDGFGDPAAPTGDRCSATGTDVSDNTDCDDALAVCNTDCTNEDGDSLALCAGDCDDSAVTGASCTTGCMPFYKDADGDTFGLAMSSVTTCAPPPGYTFVPGDCADTPVSDPVCGDGDGSFCNPMVAEGPPGDASCSDRADNDCDGLFDSEDPACAGFTHGGWADVVALGPKRDVAGLYVRPDGATSRDLADSDMRVTLTWNAFVGAPPDGYEVFRSSASGAHDFRAPLATVSGGSTRTYTDTAVTPGTEYWYVVRPTVGGVDFATSERFSEIRVVVPPDNMALVHRWIANQEVCGLMPPANAATIDPNAAYRCNFTGRGGAGGFYDLGHDLLVDRFELGCNTSQPTVTYDTVDGRCREGGIEANRANSGAVMTMVSNAPHLPPLVLIDQGQSLVACGTHAVSVNHSRGTFVARRMLLSQAEWHAAAAWSPALTDATIGDIEDGATAAGTADCNSNRAHSGSMETHLDRVGMSGRVFRTGSLEATASCRSRYGIQDMVGNVHEWVTDQCSWSVSGVCTATGAIDATNLDMDGYVNALPTGSLLSSATYFSPALGVPLRVAEDGASTPAVFGVSRFHDDVWSIVPTGTGGLVVGGGAQTAGACGRWSQSWMRESGAATAETGVRCGVPYP